MKKAIKWFGIIVLVAVIGFSFIGCDFLTGDDDGGKGSGTTFTDGMAFARWIYDQPDNTVDNPYRVKLNIKDVSFNFSAASLGLFSKWTWNNGSKYVFLDCSGSTFVSTGPGNNNSGAFEGCSTLVGIILPDSIANIGGYAFSGCTNLASINIPDNVKNIANYAFNDCTKLTSITIPGNVTSIGDGAFANTKLTGVTIPNNVTSIGDHAFANTQLTGITIPNKVSYLSGFNGCAGLTNITIPNSVTTIGDSAFNNCVLLTSVTIPGSVTAIKARAFGKTTNLTSVTFEGTIPSDDFINADIFYDSESFPGDLRHKFYLDSDGIGIPGTYTRPNGSDTWTLQL